ncbi:hypothetical protein ACWD6R_38615, partial [Streptomyces sp. NPDC005151]
MRVRQLTQGRACSEVVFSRWIEGLEVAVVDRSPLQVASPEPEDLRSITVNVAGPAALLVGDFAHGVLGLQPAGPGFVDAEEFEQVCLD